MIRTAGTRRHASNVQTGDKVDGHGEWTRGLITLYICIHIAGIYRYTLCVLTNNFVWYTGTLSIGALVSWTFLL